MGTTRTCGRGREDHGYKYVLAVANTEEVRVMTANGPKLMTVKEAEQLLIAPQDWQRLSVRTGTKGPLFFDWACIPILHQWQDDKRQMPCSFADFPTIPLRRPTIWYLDQLAPHLRQWLRLLEKDWRIEEHFENGKDLGLDHYEVRSFVGWFRHVTLVMLILAMLTIICMKERSSSLEECTNQTASFPIALTVPEVRHLLGRLIFPLSRNTRIALARELVASMEPSQS